MWPSSLSRTPLSALYTPVAKPAISPVQMPLVAVAKPEDNPVRLPFIAQKQLQCNWCWSAVATSVGLFYGSGNWTQCAVATGQVNGIIHPETPSDCCETPGSAGCDIDGYLYYSLKQVRALDHWAPKKPTPVELYRYLSHYHELVCVRILWKDSGSAAHFTTICGCTDPSDGNAFTITTSDTLHGFGGTTLAYADFPEKYNGGGTWTDTFLTKGGFVSPMPYGSADDAALAVNNNGDCASLRSRNGELFVSVGRIERISRTLTFGSETRVANPGSGGGIALDDSGNCVVVYLSGNQLCYRTGTLDVLKASVTWQAAHNYKPSGSGSSIALAQDGTGIQVHAENGKLYCSMGSLLGDGTLDWSPPAYYGDGAFNRIAMDTDGTCVELHPGPGADAGTLFCRVGIVDTFNVKISWGPILPVGSGSSGSISLGANGQCVVTWIDAGSVWLRHGKVDVAAGYIDWFPKLILVPGEATAVAIDDLGRFVECHVTKHTLYTTLGP
jgi:hypothetical protein